MIRMRGTALLLAALLLAAAAPVPAAAARPLALGVGHLPSDDIAEVDAFTASVGGVAPAIWTLWSMWGGPDASFPSTTFLDALRDRGIAPMVNWEPVDPSRLMSTRYTYARIAAGRHDAYIRDWARAAAAWGGRLYLRFAHEMNGTWFPWGIGRLTNTATSFKAAWRHVVGIFRAEGAQNVRFVWSPYMLCPWCGSYGAIYPGDRWVHHTSFSAFDWRNVWHPPRSMRNLFRPSVNELRRVAPKKSIIVAETGTHSGDGYKADWIRDGYPAVHEAFPEILAIVWFDVRTGDPKHPDWRLTSPPAALASYAAIVAQPPFQGRLIP